MKIVVLDGYVLNPGDLSWEALGEATIYDRTPPELVAERARDAEIVLTNKVVVDVSKLPELRYVGVMATGYNVVNIPAARERGIVVTNVPGYATRSVAQHTFALLLELAHHIGHHARTILKWPACPDYCYWDYPQIELAGLTMGIIGYGNIGREVEKLVRAFGMNVLLHTRTTTGDTVFRESDVVSLHCPLTPATRGSINSARLASMKPTAFLINTGRGGLVVEQELADALNAGKIAGAGLDVLSTEPPRPDNPLLTAKNCIITPHIAWATRAARERLLRAVVENIQAFEAGKPQNVVSYQPL
jgi:glycerate dehydrogenase